MGDAEKSYLKMNFNLIRFLDKNVGIPICYTIYTLNKLVSYQSQFFEPKRILIVRFWGIGSLILASPTFKAIRKRFPDSKITLFTLENNKGIYDGSNLFDDIIYFKLKSVKGAFFEFFKVLQILRKNKYDLAIDLEPFARIATILISMSNIKMKIGYYTEKQGKSMLYDKAIVWNNKQHASESFFDIVRLLGIEPKFLELERIYFSKDDETYVDNLLKQFDVQKSDKLIGINVNASDFGTARRWPYQNFAELADRITEQFKVKIVFVGANFDKELIEKTLNCMRNKNVINLAGKTTIKQLAVLVQNFDLFITNDSGPMHIAVAMKTPVITFFGPETPLIYGPLGEKHTVFYKHLPCSPCLSVYNAKRINCKKDAECIKSITVDEVMEKVEDYLK